MPVNRVTRFRQRAGPAFTDSGGARRPAIGVSGAGHRAGNGIRDSPVMALSARPGANTGQEPGKSASETGAGGAGPARAGRTANVRSRRGRPAGRGPGGLRCRAVSRRTAIQSGAVRRSRAVTYGGPSRAASLSQAATAIPAAAAGGSPALRRAVPMRIRKRGKAPTARHATVDIAVITLWARSVAEITDTREYYPHDDSGGTHRGDGR